MTELTDNIKELAQIVRKAKASVFVMECISSFEPNDIDSDDIELRFEVDDRDTGTNVSIVDECGQAAKVIVALVEALEKAQRANSAQDYHINQMAKRIRRLELKNTGNGQHINSLNRQLAGKTEIEQQQAARIAELESRTVKMPKLKMLEDHLAEVEVEEQKAILLGARLEFHRSLTAAGIKWEAE